MSNKRPHPLPFCDYPSAKDTALHGVQPLPDELPIVDLKTVQRYRSNQYDVVGAKILDPAQILQLVREMALSFSKRSPLARHIIPPKYHRMVYKRLNILMNLALTNLVNGQVPTSFTGFSDCSYSPIQRAHHRQSRLETTC
jgi:hypothetical protein